MLNRICARFAPLAACKFFLYFNGIYRFQFSFIYNFTTHYSHSLPYSTHFDSYIHTHTLLYYLFYIVNNIFSYIRTAEVQNCTLLYFAFAPFYIVSCHFTVRFGYNCFKQKLITSPSQDDKLLFQIDKSF